MIKVDITAPDVDRMMEVLKHFPELAEKHYRPALTLDVAGLKAQIEPQIPVRSGRAAKTFGSKVTGKGFNIKGRVGWYDKSDPWYIRLVESGVKGHAIEVAPVKKQVLAWPGGFSKGHTIKHPGLSARGFMAAGFSAMQPVIENDLAQANERILADLAAI